MKAMIVIDNWENVKKENIMLLLDEMEAVLIKYGLKGGFKFP